MRRARLVAQHGFPRASPPPFCPGGRAHATGALHLARRGKCRYLLGKPARTSQPMKRLELLVESVILASRWLLVVFYLGLALALAVYAVSFGAKLWEFVRTRLRPRGSRRHPQDARPHRRRACREPRRHGDHLGLREFRVALRQRGQGPLAGPDRRRIAEDQGGLDHRRHLLDPPAAGLPQRSDLHRGSPASGSRSFTLRSSFRRCSSH